MSNVANISIPNGAPMWAVVLVRNIEQAIQWVMRAPNIVGGSISNASVTATTLASSQGAVMSGTYTPTLTNTANVSSSSALQCQYMRVGGVVSVSGGVTLTPTLLATLTMLGISLPIASTLGATNNLGGTAASSSVASNVGPVFADTSNNRATLQLISVGTGSETFAFSFTYLIT